jgi:hypothetical protein
MNIPLKTRVGFACGEHGEILTSFTLEQLREILANNCRNALEMALYRAVMVDRQPLSLPFVAEVNTFVPVLTRLPDCVSDRWRVGVLGKGRMATFQEAEASEALLRALAIVEEWRREEEGQR